MRKALMVTLIVALSLAAFVSCNSEMADSSQTGDKLVSVVLGDNPNAKGISVTTTHDQGAETYYWFYTAVKKDNSIYRTGETGADGWKAVKNGTGLVGADLGLFSKGQWEFSFRGYKDNPINQSTPNYNAGYTYFHHGLAVEVSDATATAMQNNSEDKAVYISVVLNHHADYETAEVIFPAGGDNNPYLNWKYSPGNNANVTTTIAKISAMEPVLVISYSTNLDESTSEWTELARSSSYVVDTTTTGVADVLFKTFTASNSGTISLPARAYEVGSNNQETANSGIQYKMKFEVFGKDANNASELLGTTTVGAVSSTNNNTATRSSVVAYSGGTIKLSRSSVSSTEFEDAIEPNDSLIHVVIKDSVEVVTATKSASVASSGSTNVELGTTPSSDTNKSTTVAFPEGSLSGGTTVQVEVTTYPVEVAQASFGITGDNNVVAGLDISAYLDSSKITSFGSTNDVPNAVTITTYIAPGLESVNVVYNGDGAQPQSINYIAETGELSFTTTHFSGFYVTTGSEAFNVTTNTAYATYAAAVAAVGANEEIILLKNVAIGNDPLNIGTADAAKNFVVNLNGKTLTGRTNLKHGSLTIKNGTVSLADGQALNVYGSDTEATDYSVLTVESDVTVNAKYGVCVFGPTAGSKTGYGAVVNFKGTFVGSTDDANGIFVSGNIADQKSETSEQATTAASMASKNVINVSGAISTSGQAIALNGSATVNIVGGAKVTGREAVGAKRGCLNVTGGTLTSNGAYVNPVVANNNGTEATGAVISITSTYNYAGSINVSLAGGSLVATNGCGVYVGHSVDGNSTKAFTKGVSLNIVEVLITSNTGNAYKVYVAEKITGDSETYPTVQMQPWDNN